MASIVWNSELINQRRERIAIAAMQGVLARRRLQDGFVPEDVARDAVAMADALVAELNKEKSGG